MNSLSSLPRMISVLGVALLVGARLMAHEGPEHEIEELTEQIAKLIEYNTSCAPTFVQRAGVVAVDQGEPVIARTHARFLRARDHLVAGLRNLPGIEVAVPGGSMYAFFRVDGVTDSLAFCKRLVAEAGLGLQHVQIEMVAHVARPRDDLVVAVDVIRRRGGQESHDLLPIKVRKVFVPHTVRFVDSVKHRVLRNSTSRHVLHGDSPMLHCTNYSSSSSL